MAGALIEEKRYLDAAEVIVSALNPADYHDFMKRVFEQPRYTQSRIHEAVLTIDPKVVITTNYDTVYDRYCTQGDAAEGYSVLKYTDGDIIAQLRSPTRCVLKAHGCVTMPNGMVLTRTDYFSARQKAPHFYSVLDAIFLTHTILFIGYSLEDPDIQMVLESVNIAAPSSHGHYFVCGSGMPEALKASKAKSYNIHFYEYESENYVELNESLANLAERVLDARNENPNV